MIKIVFFIILFKTSLAEGPKAFKTWIIRNVGQGQWITLADYDSCVHFDFGGEFNYFKNHRLNFIKQCKNKQNILMLSHADWDHYSYFKQIIKMESQKICWGYKPPFQKSYFDFSLAPHCRQIPSLPIYTNVAARIKNKTSAIHLLHSFLITGDSTTTEEKKWSPLVKNQKVKFLIVGHHGSQTSTGENLLKSLPQIKMAFISARKARYGHPHTKTTQRLQKYKVPYLTTEDWGTIILSVL